jgi:hypothetical protein
LTNYLPSIISNLKELPIIPLEDLHCLQVVIKERFGDGFHRDTLLYDDKALFKAVVGEVERAEMKTFKFQFQFLGPSGRINGPDPSLFETINMPKLEHLALAVDNG